MSQIDMDQSFQSFLNARRVERDKEIAALRVRTRRQNLDRVNFMFELARMLNAPRGYRANRTGRTLTLMIEFHPDREPINRANGAIVNTLGADHPLLADSSLIDANSTPMPKEAFNVLFDYRKPVYTDFWTEAPRELK